MDAGRKELMLKVGAACTLDGKRVRTDSLGTDEARSCPHLEELASWAHFYQAHFGIQIPLDLPLPPRKPGFTRLIVVAEGITYRDVWSRWLDTDKVETSVSLWAPDKHVLLEDDRNPSLSTYAVGVSASREPDSWFVGRSPQNLRDGSVPCMTLLEHMLQHLRYGTETGKRLNVLAATICAGTRYIDGSVPVVRTVPAFGGLRMWLVRPNVSRYDLRVRRVLIT